MISSYNVVQHNFNMFVKSPDFTAAKITEDYCRVRWGSCRTHGGVVKCMRFSQEPEDRSGDLYLDERIILTWILKKVL
jgi:hypothetical protein